jgi:hypothetical protein
MFNHSSYLYVLGCVIADHHELSTVLPIQGTSFYPVDQNN